MTIVKILGHGILKSIVILYFDYFTVLKEDKLLVKPAKRQPREDGSELNTQHKTIG